MCHKYDNKLEDAPYIEDITEEKEIEVLSTAYDVAKAFFEHCEVKDIDTLLLKMHYLVELHLLEGKAGTEALSYAYDYGHAHLNSPTYSKLNAHDYSDILEGWLTGQAQGRAVVRP